MEPTFEKTNYIETGTPKNSGELYPGRVIARRENAGRYFFECDNHCQLEVIAIESRIIRFRFAPEGLFDDGFSYGIKEDLDLSGLVMQVEENEKEYALKTDDLVIRIAKKKLILRIEDHDGFVISQDEKGFHWYDNDDFGGENVIMSRNIQARERFYGLGDVPGHKELRGQRRTLWGSDVYGYDEATDPLYKNIPFFEGFGLNFLY